MVTMLRGLESHMASSQRSEGFFFCSSFSSLALEAKLGRQGTRRKQTWRLGLDLVLLHKLGHLLSRESGDRHADQVFEVPADA